LSSSSSYEQSSHIELSTVTTKKKGKKKRKVLKCRKIEDGVPRSNRASKIYGS